MYFSPDTQPTLQQLTYMVTPSGKEVRIIENIAAMWKTVGILFNFDRTGYTIDLIDVHHDIEHYIGHPSKPIACCTNMMKLWLRGRGRKPISWATLVEVLRNTRFNTLANEVEIAIKGGGEGKKDGETEGIVCPHICTQCRQSKRTS